MMGKATVNLQDSFLNQVRKENSEIEMMLVNGTHLAGLVRGFDNFTVVVNAGGKQHLVYKHAIAQIVSQRPVQESYAPQQAQPPAAREPREPREPRESRESRPPQAPRPAAERPARPEPAPAPAAPAPEPRPQAPRPGRPESPQTPRDKFNMLDLRDVKLDPGKS